MSFNSLIRRILLALPVLFGVITISFFTTIAVPGDPVLALLPEEYTDEQYRQATLEFGMDQPLVTQWLRYLGRTLQGDFGRSLRTRRPVIKDIAPALVATLELALVASLPMALLGVLLGVVTAVRQNTVTDYVLSLFSMGGVAVPIFWLALMAQVIIYGRLDWLPAGGRIDESVLMLHPFARRTGSYLLDTLLAGNVIAFRSVVKHTLLPASVLAYPGIALIVRVTRASMREVLHADFIRTARGMGVAERRITYYHALKNAFLPTLTVLGFAFGRLLQGTILVEAIFNWPGLGLYAVQSIIRLDYPGIIAVSVVFTIVYVVINLVVDILYPVIDPRLRE